ncbi:hypothetical protein MOQ72_16645 [Saccharopolyspora sp. K220]|uniref:hypothetical protein n=1 Tax=Saccharopolyspora soli TaxID=2926618 RepID=UPI001F594496|nr:hypothetical protein [Saccharopolyspora soli]MCI2419075.1 hypothetical protein [Saccharopolyspora soli]
MNIDINRFVERYVAVWNEPDPVARRNTIAALWDADGVEVTESAQYHGHQELEARITEAHDQLVRAAGFVFRSADDATGHHDTIAFTTHMVPADGGGDIAWTGRVFVVLDEDGRIRSDHQFTVPSEGASTAPPRWTSSADSAREIRTGSPRCSPRTSTGC